MATGRIGTTPVLTTRWSKAPAAGTTSLSGLDDNSVSLVYSVGYEAVYQNGVLLSRGNDYTATNGTTITLTTATVAGDIIEVFANQTIPLTDTYSQTVANGKFINNTLTTTTGDIIYASAANTPARLAIGSTDQVLKVSGGIPAWGAAPSPSYVGASVYATNVTSSFVQYADNILAFANENFDTDSFHDNTTNNSRITIPTGKGGKYLITAWVRSDTTISDSFIPKLYKNGSSLTGSGDGILYGGRLFNQEGLTISSAPTQVWGTAVVSLAAADYIQLAVYTRQATFNCNHYAQFSATFLGA